MPLFGAHMSIAGGYYKAVEAGAALGMQTVQLFTKNNNQWRGKPISDDDARRFQSALANSSIAKPCAHASYLINLASPADDLWAKSRDALVDELQRAEQLGLAGVVFHPGSATSGTTDDGLARIITAIDEIHACVPGLKAQLWLETTAGQGTQLGWRFEELAVVLQRVKHAERLGVCVDTCHVFAAGYGLQTASEYSETMQRYQDHLGWSTLRCFHVNDSKKPRGSRVDRHEHLGAGAIGLEAFRHLVNDPRFAQTPMYLETEKGLNEAGEDWDAVNLRVLSGLLA